MLPCYILLRDCSIATGNYKSAVSRVQTHAEAICSWVGGAARERDILKDLLTTMLDKERALSEDHKTFSLIFKIAYIYGFRPWIQALGMLTAMGAAAQESAHAETGWRSYFQLSVAQLASHGGGRLGAVMALMRSWQDLMMENLHACGSLLTLSAVHDHNQGMAGRLTSLLDVLPTLGEEIGTGGPGEILDTRNVRTSTGVVVSTPTRVVQTPGSPAGPASPATTSSSATGSSSAVIGAADDDDARIVFSNADIMTPSGNLLVKGLSFEVRKESLLLTGHNGAGKSSIFRAMAGLWKLGNPYPPGVAPIEDDDFLTPANSAGDLSAMSSSSKNGASSSDTANKNREGPLTRRISSSRSVSKNPYGRISRPPDDKIFYLPQKPYNIPGSLREQIYYPRDPPSCVREDEEEIRVLLEKVDMLTFANDLDRPRNWESILSLSQKQRLAIARLWFHRPRFAILDECTSAVSVDLEELLYEECQRLKIVYVTVCHRPALRKFHQNQLCLIGGQKYTIQPISAAVKNEFRAKRELYVARHRSMTSLAPEDLMRIEQFERGLRGEALSDLNLEKRLEQLRSAPYREQLAGAGNEVRSMSTSAALRKLRSFSENTADAEEQEEGGQASEDERQPPSGSEDERQLGVELIKAKYAREPPARKAWRLFRLATTGGDAWRNLGVVVLLLASRTAHWEVWARIVQLQVRAMLKNDRLAVLKMAVLGVFHGIFAAFVDEYGDFFQRRFSRGLTENLAKQFLGTYLSRNQFYHLKIPDADARGTAELSDLSTKMANLFTTSVSRILDVLWFSFRLYMFTSVQQTSSAAGSSSPSSVTASQSRNGLILFLYNFSTALLLRFCLPDLRYFADREKSLEAAFRAAHYRTQTHAESVAFFSGDQREAAHADAAFAELKLVLLDKNTADARYRFWVTLLSREDGRRFCAALPELLSLYLQQGGSAERNSYADVSIRRVTEAFANIATLQEDFGKMLGAADRVYDLLAELGAMPAGASGATSAGGSRVPASSSDHTSTEGGPPPNGNGNGRQIASGGSMSSSAPGQDGRPYGGAVVASSNTNVLSFEGVDIVTPTSRCLAANLNFQTTKGLMVTGPNSCGKTALFRHLSKLWPLRKGIIRRPKRLLLVPQNCYMVLGSLQEQVSYPDKAPLDTSSSHLHPSATTSAYTACVEAALERVDLAYLGRREGLDSKKPWENVLSLGEQQRVCFARVFYHLEKLQFLERRRKAPVFSTPPNFLAGGGGAHQLHGAEAGTSSSPGKQRPGAGADDHRDATTVVLDECTSAVAVEIEETLYQRLREYSNVQCVTISQRLAGNLSKYHEKEITLGAQTNLNGFSQRQLSSKLGQFLGRGV